jgi:hypothetical protein
MMAKRQKYDKNSFKLKLGELKAVEIHKNDKGELLSVTIGNKEISGFELDVLEFLKKQGEL